MRFFVIFFLFFAGCATPDTIHRENPRPRTRMSYEVGRAMLPGMLCLIGGAMYTDTNRGKGVQSAVYFGAFISIGAFEKKRKAKDYLISIGAAGVGFGLGSLYKYSTR